MFLLEASGSSFRHFIGRSEGPQLSISLYFLCLAPSVLVPFLITFSHPHGISCRLCLTEVRFSRADSYSSLILFADNLSTEAVVWDQIICPSHPLPCQQQSSTKNLEKRCWRAVVKYTEPRESFLIKSPLYPLQCLYPMKASK